MKSAVIALLLLSGCSDPPTTILVSLSIGMGPAPTAVTLSVFDDKKRLVDRRPVATPAFPGTVIVSGLPAVEQRLRLVVRSADQQLAGAEVTTRPRSQVTLALVLSTATADGDGDGVPDVVDNCPGAANADQADAEGNRVGDACTGGDAGVADLGAADLALAVTDLAVGDLARDAAGTSLCPSGLPLCDGFETGSLNLTLWHREIDNTNSDGGVNGSITVDGTRSYRGNYSLHVHMDKLPDGEYPSAWLVESTVVPQSALYLRAFVYFPQPLSVADVGFLFGRNPAYELWGLGAATGGRLGYSDGIGNSRTADSLIHYMPVNRWVCVEWLMSPEMGDMLGGTKMWIDDVEQTDLTFATGWPASPFPSWVMLGLLPQASGEVAPLDIWFDEVAVDSQPIGCNR